MPSELACAVLRPDGAFGLLILDQDSPCSLQLGRDGDVSGPILRVSSRKSLAQVNNAHL